MNCLEDLKECSKNCSKPNECKIVGDRYKCVLPDKDEFILCKYMHIDPSFLEAKCVCIGILVLCF